MNYKIAIIGDGDSILGFKALGVHTFSISNVNDGLEALKRIHEEDDYGILFVIEDWVLKLQKGLEKFEGQALPAVIAIPSKQGSTGEGLKNISRIVEKAVGSDILSNKE